MKWCFLHQRLMGWFPEPGNRWSAAARRHLEKCAVCRQTLEQEQAIIRALHDSARRTRTEFPDVLRARIVAHLDAEEGRDWGTWQAWRWVRLGAAAAVVAVVLMVLWPSPASDEQRFGSVATAPVQSREVTRVTWLAEPSAVWQLTELGGGPLEGELASAIDDSRRLVSAVVHSCVPEPAAELMLVRAESWLTSRP